MGVSQLSTLRWNMIVERAIADADYWAFERVHT